MIHPPHPLVGQTLKVLGRRREAGETSWIARLADGSRVRLPSLWTDHPVGEPTVPRLRSGVRATPEALREFCRRIGVTKLDAALSGKRHFNQPTPTHYSPTLYSPT